MASHALAGVSLRPKVFCTHHEGKASRTRRQVFVRARQQSEEERQCYSVVTALGLAGMLVVAPVNYAAAATPLVMASQGDLLQELLEKNSGKGVKVIKGKQSTAPPPAAFSSATSAAKPAEKKPEPKPAPKKQVEKPKPAPAPKLESQKLTLAAPPRTATQGSVPFQAAKKPAAAPSKAAPAAAAAGAAAIAGAAAAGAAASAPSISLPSPPSINLPSVSLPSLPAPSISGSQADLLEAGAVVAAELVGLAIAGAIVGDLTAKRKTA